MNQTRRSTMSDDDIKDGIYLDEIPGFDQCDMCEEMVEASEIDYGLCQDCYDEPEAIQFIKANIY